MTDKPQEQTAPIASDPVASDKGGYEELTIFSSGSLGGNSAIGEGNYIISTEKERKLDQWLESISEFFSSILVKETRQMIRGKQFVWTFFAMIGITFVVTLTAIMTVNGAEDLGPALMVSYLVILGFPLIVIIPFFTFRSIADEHSEETLNMLLITTMRPSQIIFGKLGSAMMQAIIYMSVVAPCVAFTILLRGVDINQLFTSLAGVFLASVLLSAVGLSFGASAKSSMSSAIWQLLFALILVGSFASWWGLCAESTFGYQWREEERFIFKVSVATAITTGVLFLATACAQITFPSENRSTLIRLSMLLQQVVFFGLLFGIAFVDNTPGDEVYWVLMVFGLHYWILMGAMMAAVPRRLSNRVKRSMPQTVLGSLFGGLLMPGPGRGFLFAWINGLFASAVCVFVVSVFTELDVEEMGTAIGICLIFFSMFLSASYLVIRLGMRKAKRPSLAFGVIIALVIYFLPIAIVESIRAIAFQGSFNYGGTFLNYLTWFGSLSELDRGRNFEFSLLIPMVISSVILTGVAVLSASRELIVRSIATPTHVIDEDKAYAKAKRKEGIGETIDDIFAE